LPRRTRPQVDCRRACAQATSAERIRKFAFVGVVLALVGLSAVQAEGDAQTFAKTGGFFPNSDRMPALESGARR
jgi:hypothetical protein